MEKKDYLRKRHHPSWIVLFLLFFNQCLLNPIVREILELDLEKNNHNDFKSLLLLGGLIDRSIPTATVTPSVGNIILANSSLKVVFSKSMEPNSLSATLGTRLSATWTQTSLPNDTANLSGNISVGTNTFVLDAKDSLGISLTQVIGTYVVLSSDTKFIM